MKKCFFNQHENVRCIEQWLNNIENEHAMTTKVNKEVFVANKYLANFEKQIKEDKCNDSES